MAAGPLIKWDQGQGVGTVTYTYTVPGLWETANTFLFGIKQSGLGCEGVRYAIEDMTEQRLLVIRDTA